MISPIFERLYIQWLLPLAPDVLQGQGRSMRLQFSHTARSLARYWSRGTSRKAHRPVLLLGANLHALFYGRSFARNLVSWDRVLLFELLECWFWGIEHHFQILSFGFDRSSLHDRQLVVCGFKCCFLIFGGAQSVINRLDEAKTCEPG